MFFTGLLLLCFIIIFLFLISYWLGERRWKQNELLLKQEKDLQSLAESKIKDDIAFKDELIERAEYFVNLQENKNKLELEYINDLKQEKIKLEKELKDIHNNMIPTREQLDTWLFTLQADNRLSSKDYQKIIKLYDVKRIYPGGKL